MIKILFNLFICFSFLLVQNTIAQNDFYSRAVSLVTENQKNLIAMDVVSKTYKGRAIIENGDLYIFLKKTKGFDEETYQAFMKDLLLNQRRLQINYPDIEGFGFISVKEFKEVNEFASKGKKEFIKHYFNGRRLKSEFIQNTQNSDVIYAVSDKLFKWKIVNYVADLSGLLTFLEDKNKQ